MFPEKCKALLKSADNTLLEKGYASFSLLEGTADFTGEFVPLYQIGTVMKIVCIEQGHSTHIVTGKTYLSSPKLLRLTDIRCELVDGAEQYLAAMGFEIPAKIRPHSIRNGLFRSSAKAKWDQCIITQISMEGAVIRCPAFAEEPAQDFDVMLGKPVFSKETPIRLRRTAGKGPIRYYTFIGTDKGIANELSVFIRTASLAVLGTHYTE